MHFRKLEELGDIAIKTYVSEKKAKSSFLQSWYGSKESDFEEGGRYVIIPVIETISEK